MCESAPLWPCWKAPTSRAGGVGFDPCFSHSSHASDLKIDTVDDALGVVGSVLGLGPVAVYCQ